jgi:hypothetical protein
MTHDNETQTRGTQATGAATGASPARTAAPARRAYHRPQVARIAAGRELLEVLGPAQAGYGGGGGVPSDRAIKTDVTEVDPAAVLTALTSLPVSEWRYRHEGEEVRHLGPMAQDFQAAFGLGDSEREIQIVDALGVCMAAIQALAEQVARLEARLEANLPE